MKKKYNLLLTFAMVGVMALTGCHDKKENADVGSEDVVESVESEDKNESSENEKVTEDDEVELADWEGKWNSIAFYANEDDVKGAYKEVSEREEITEEEAKNDFLKSVEVDFGAIEFDNKTITFYKNPDGEVIDKAQYTYVDKHPMEHGGKTLYWYEFKSDGTYPHLLLMPVHGEEHMPHFHLRVGDDVESMLAKEDWYPTFVSPTVTLDQVYEEIAE